MSEILQIFQHSTPPYHQMPPRIQQGLVNADSQCNRSIDSGFLSPAIFDVTDSFLCSEFAGSSFTNFPSSPFDELSKVTAIIGHTQSSKKRKLEIDDANIGLQDPSNAKKDTNNGQSKIDYIHVRARRGQATDAHSLAERVRRDKMKKKMQILQDLVPGCNKITNKAAILDEIIYYVQNLQMQVELLRMQLDATTTSLILQDGQLIG